MAQRVKGSGSGSTMVQPPPAKEPSAVEYLQIKIPLKPQEKAVAFPQNFAETLQEEYAIKYLQRLGALPTAGNIATVLKHLPLDDCQITSAWKARGSLADVVMVDLYPKPNAGLRLTPGDQQADPTMVSSTGDRRRDDASDTLHVPLSTDKPYQVGSVCLSFDDMKHRYLLPFRHATRPEADVLALYAMKHDEPVPFAHIPALANIHTKPVALQLFGRRANQRRIRCIEERATPPEIKQEFITHMLHAFLTALPFVALGVRSDKEQNKLSEFLLHDDLVQLIETTVQYLYLEVFFKLGCLGAADLVKSATIQSYHQNAAAEIETLYVSMVRLFNTIKQRMAREEKKGVALFLPLHLLALRVAVETVFRCQYPVSFNITEPTMQYILTKMDDQLTKVLDGDRLLSRIGILETTCESSKAMASHSFQATKRRARLRDQYFQTSEAIHTIFPKPLSGKCRKMIKFRGGAAIGNYPVPAVVDVTDAAHDEGNNHANVSGFDEAARSATLPSASLEARLELLHVMERKRTRAVKDLTRHPRPFEPVSPRHAHSVR